MTTHRSHTNAAEEDTLERWAASEAPTIRDDAKIIQGDEAFCAEMRALLNAAVDESSPNLWE